MEPHLFLALIRELQLMLYKTIIVLMGLSVLVTIAVVALRTLGYDL